MQPGGRDLFSCTLRTARCFFQSASPAIDFALCLCFMHATCRQPSQLRSKEKLSKTCGIRGNFEESGCASATHHPHSRCRQACQLRCVQIPAWGKPLHRPQVSSRSRPAHPQSSDSSLNKLLPKKRPQTRSRLMSEANGISEKVGVL